VLVLVGLACLVFQLRMPGRAIAESDYRAAAQVLEAEAQSGDVVLLQPWWTERARLFIPERIPVVGYQGAEGDPLELHPRVWVLASTAMPASDVYRSSLAQQRASLGPARNFGGLSLQLFDNRRFHRPLVTDYSTLLSSAKVYLERPDGSRSDCPWDGRSHRCGNGAEVAAEWHEIKFAPHKCIKLFPPGGAAKLVLEFAPTPAAGQLALRAGMIWDRGFFHTPEMTATDLVVEVDGQPATSLTVPVGVEGLLGAEGPPLAQGSSVRVWSRSQNPAYRELCVELYGVEKPAP
jgi:hypothetical protein